MNNDRRPPMGQIGGRDSRRPGSPGGRQQAGPQGGPRHLKHGPGPAKHGGPRRPSGKPGSGRPVGGKRPGEGREREPETDEILSGPVEANYLRELVSANKRIEVKLHDGSTHSGTIEYWDQRFIRLTPDKGSNKFIFKHEIKYILELEANS